jgi:hypothetical protein
VPLITRLLSINKDNINARKDGFFRLLRDGQNLLKNNCRNASEITEKLTTLYEEMETLLVRWEERRIWLEIANDYLLNR